MIKKLSLGLVGLVVLSSILLWAAIEIGNPETRTLDDESRSEAPGEFLALTDGVTHYQVAGPEDGQVVVLVHGFSVPFYIWNTTFDSLVDAGYRVVRFDMFGRGYSDRPDTRYDGAFFARQISDLVTSLGISEPVDLVGLSMGGAVVARFAGDNPDRVRRLVFVDPTYSTWGTPPLPRPFFDVMAALRLFPDIAESQMTDFLYPENYPSWVDQYQVQLQYEGFRNAIVSTIFDFGPEDHLASYERIQAHDIDVLLVWGEEDQTVPIAGAELIQGVLDVEFLPIADSGHLPHMEQARITNPAIVEFLRRSTQLDSTD